MPIPEDDNGDTTDWLSTPLSALAPLESSLRCQVCKEFFTTPMMTSCSHTFCSLCIRRYLSQEGRCPACREQDQEMKLRRNWVVEELVTNFSKQRAGLLGFAQKAARREASGVDNGDGEADSQRPRKRRKVETRGKSERVNGTGGERRSTRSHTRQVASQASQNSLPSTQDEVADSDEGSLYDGEADAKAQHRTTTIPITSAATGPPEPHDGRVQCPCCSRRVKEPMINLHLDSCINGDSTIGIESPSTSSPAPISQPNGTVSIAYTQTKPSKHADRLPFINYSLLNDNALRKKLKELGISATGSKELMRKRHTEWVNLWNANCDSLNPITKRQLLAQLEKWERTMGRQIEGNRNTPGGGGATSSSGGVMVKDFDREGYVKDQKSNFDDLIAKARQKVKQKREEQEKQQGEQGGENNEQTEEMAVDEYVETKPTPAMDAEPNSASDILDAVVPSPPPAASSLQPTSSGTSSASAAHGNSIEHIFGNHANGTPLSQSSQITRDAEMQEKRRNLNVTWQEHPSSSTSPQPIQNGVDSRVSEQHDRLQPQQQQEQEQETIDLISPDKPRRQLAFS